MRTVENWNTTKTHPTRVWMMLLSTPNGWVRDHADPHSNRITVRWMQTEMRNGTTQYCYWYNKKPNTAIEYTYDQTKTTELRKYGGAHTYQRMNGGAPTRRQERSGTGTNAPTLSVATIRRVNVSAAIITWWHAVVPARYNCVFQAMTNHAYHTLHTHAENNSCKCDVIGLYSDWTWH